MRFNECEILCFATKVLRINRIREQFSAFFFSIKLYNRLFQQAEPFFLLNNIEREAFSPH